MLVAKIMIHNELKEKSHMSLPLLNARTFDSVANYQYFHRLVIIFADVFIAPSESVRFRNEAITQLKMLDIWVMF